MNEIITKVKKYLEPELCSFNLTYSPKMEIDIGLESNSKPKSNVLLESNLHRHIPIGKLTSVIICHISSFGFLNIVTHITHT